MVRRHSRVWASQFSQPPLLPPCSEPPSFLPWIIAIVETRLPVSTPAPMVYFQWDPLKTKLEHVTSPMSYSQQTPNLSSAKWAQGVRTTNSFSLSQPMLPGRAFSLAVSFLRIFFTRFLQDSLPLLLDPLFKLASFFPDHPI